MEIPKESSYFIKSVNSQSKINKTFKTLKTLFPLERIMLSPVVSVGSLRHNFVLVVLLVLFFINKTCKTFKHCFGSFACFIN